MKKGSAFPSGLLIGAVVILVVISIVIAITIFAFSNIKDTQTGNSSEWNITDTGTEMVGAVAQLLPGAGIAVGVIFVVVLIYLFVRRMGG